MGRWGSILAFVFDYLIGDPNIYKMPAQTHLNVTWTGFRFIGSIVQAAKASGAT